MKAELTQENKAKFFSLYLGQRVLKTSINNSTLTGRWIDKVIDDSCDAEIELKPLSQISDEDAIFTHELLGYNQNSPIDQKIAIGRLFVIDRCQEHCFLSYYCFIIDFLRSRGYALPWMGLSVDELVAAGWIRLV